MRHIGMAALAVLGWTLASWAASAAEEAPCNADAPCAVPGGSYHMMLPDGWDGTSALPVLVFFHGHNASGRMVFRSGGLKESFLNHGYLVIAPNGEGRGSNGQLGWAARVDSGGRDNVTFTRAVLDDVAARYPVDRARIYAAGFSSGGSMAWMVACYDGANYAGIVSISGALRRPVPANGVCPGGPVRLLQFHGFTDKTVPLEGRGLGNWHQGDLFESFGILRRTNGCRTNPDSVTLGDPYRCRVWADSCSAADLKMCLHDGGHGLPPGWAEEARTWLERSD